VSSFCKACNAELLWAKTATGKAKPLNHDPDSGGNVEEQRCVQPQVDA